MDFLLPVKRRASFGVFRASAEQPLEQPLDDAWLLCGSLVLRGQTRDQLPRTIASSLATWVHDHPLERSAVAKGVLVLRDTMREALIFGAQHGTLSLDGRQIAADGARTKKINVYLRTSSDEVRECMRLALFVGRWLCKAGAPTTVLALLGVQA